MSMAALRGVYESLGLLNPQTYVQSGNVVFSTAEDDTGKLARKIETAIQGQFHFRPDVVLRSFSEFKQVLFRNPFGSRTNIEAGKLLVMFLPKAPDAETRKAITQIEPREEELHVIGREIYIYFPDGMGRSKLPAALDKVLKKTGTGRNWNTITKVSEMMQSR